MYTANDQAAEEFVEVMGMVLLGDGLPRTAGRIMAMLILMDRPAGLDEIAECLQVSRSGVSTNTRELERVGAIKRTTKPGDRQYYFEIAGDAMSPLLNSHVARMSKAVTTIRKASDALPADWEQARERLTRMDEFYSIAIEKTQDIIDHLAEAEQEKERPSSPLPHAVEDA